jgi:hypothetical protein
MNRYFFAVALSAVVVASSPAAADRVDGQSPMICAVTEAAQCDAIGTCARDLPQNMNIPDFIHVDFDGRRISATRPDGEEVETEIRHISVDDANIVLQGVQGGRGWSLLASRSDGHMTLTASDSDAAFVVFGACIER